MKHLILLALLAGCATAPPPRWVKPGVTQAEAEMDRGQCHAQAFSVATPTNLQIALVFSGCMRGKGYTLVN